MHPKLYGIDPKLYGINLQLLEMDAKLYGIDLQRLEIDAKLQGINLQRLEIDAKLYGIDPQLSEIDAKRCGIDPQLSEIDAKPQEIAVPEQMETLPARMRRHPERKIAPALREIALQDRKRPALERGVAPGAPFHARRTLSGVLPRRPGALPPPSTLPEPRLRPPF